LMPLRRTHQAPGRTQTLVPDPHALDRKTNGIFLSEQH
jgi:hypothetical protein